MKINRPFAIGLLVSVCALLGLGVPTALSQTNTPPPVSTAATTADLVTPTVTPFPTVDIAATATQVARSPHLTVTSSDGHVTLLIPTNALPANVSAATIKITPLTSFTDVTPPDGQPPLVAYQMAPDGLQFVTPAVIRIVMDNPKDGRIPELDSVSGQQIEALDPTRVEFDATSTKITLIAPIAHFSSVVVYSGRIAVTLNVSGDSHKVIGDTFTAQGLVDEYPVNDYPVAPVGEATYVPPRLNQTMSLQGTWLASSELSPTVIIFAPGFIGSATNGFHLENSQSFSCVKTGAPEDLVYIANVNYNDITYSVGSLPNYSPGKQVIATVVKRTAEVVVTSKPFSCNYLVTKFVAKFVQAEFATHYTVTAIDPDGQPLTYEWSNTNGCGFFLASNAAETVWLHPDSTLAGACPVEKIHQGTIKVLVSSKLGAKQLIQYFGGSADGTMVPSGTAQ